MVENVPEFTVSELSGKVKRTVEDAFPYVRVRGELGRVTTPNSGHVYLNLKDDKADLAAVIWKGVAGRLKIRPEMGMEVVATGRITTFPGQSKYQLVIERLEPAGVGALMALFEERKKKLAAEGLFAEELKKELPSLPQVIGVVTSPTGAVIRDILHRLRDRFPCHVVVWPTAVQGDRAVPQIVAGIKGFSATPPDGGVPRPDVVIVARGGGSMEDLWCFNDEAVARAVADCPIPVISAVGHETDTTLIDFVADRRAPTPTAAAEMAVPVKIELAQRLADLDGRQRSAILRQQERQTLALTAAARGLGRAETLLEQPIQRLDRAGLALPRALSLHVERCEARLTQMAVALSPKRLADRTARAGEVLAVASERLGRAPLSGVTFAAQRLTGLRLPSAPLQRQVSDGVRLLADRHQRLARAANDQHRSLAQRLKEAGRLIESYSHRSVLARGFALVKTADGSVIRSAQSATEGQGVTLVFADGDREAVLGKAGEHAVDRAPPAKKARPKKPATPKSTADSSTPAQSGLFDDG